MSTALSRAAARHWAAGACALVLLAAVPAAPATASTAAEQVFAGAMNSLRSGRVPEAYGRLMRLAEAGHPLAARYAIYMCLHGPAAFGKDFDCAPQEVEDWARTAGMEAPRVAARHYPPPAIDRRTGSR